MKILRIISKWLMEKLPHPQNIESTWNEIGPAKDKLNDLELRVMLLDTEARILARKR